MDEDLTESTVSMDPVLQSWSGIGPSDPINTETIGFERDPPQDAHAEEIMDYQLQSDYQMAQSVEHETMLQKRHGSYHEVLSPILQLPFDTLAEIARHCVSEPQRFPDANALAFTHVCSAWRTVAMSLPRVWTSLWIDMRRCKDVNRLAGGLSVWFQRARKLPFSLKISFKDNIHRSYVTWLASADGELCTFLAQYSPRLSNFDVSCDSNTLRFLSQLFRTWDLRRLKLIYLGDKMGGIEQFPTTHDLFPSLTHLQVHYLRIRVKEPKRPINWQRLTHVEIKAPLNAQNWRTIMRTCRSMKTAIFSLTVLAQSDFPVLTHRFLENMCITLNFASHCSTVLTALQAFRYPRLRNLDIKSVAPPVCMAMQPHIVLDTWNPFTSLKCMSVQVEWTSVHSLNILRLAPCLEEFTVKTKQFPTALLSALTCHPDLLQETLVTGLSILNIVIRDISEVTAETMQIFTTMILSRTAGTTPPGCTPLREVNITLGQSVFPTELLEAVGKCNTGMPVVRLRNRKGHWNSVEEGESIVESAPWYQIVR